MMTMDGCTKIAYFMTSGKGGSRARAWPYKSYSEYEQIIMLLSSVVVDSYLFYDVAVHFQI